MSATSPSPTLNRAFPLTPTPDRAFPLIPKQRSRLPSSQSPIALPISS
ncbi:hypothetical protein [Halothece sp. PCC 7418]|nr:hypothetical protein [Halothece sp. PCC 7418]